MVVIIQNSKLGQFHLSSKSFKKVICQAYNQWVNLMPHAPLLFGLLRSLTQKGSPHTAQVTQALYVNEHGTRIVFRQSRR